MSSDGEMYSLFVGILTFYVRRKQEKIPSMNISKIRNKDEIELFAHKRISRKKHDAIVTSTQIQTTFYYPFRV